MTETREAEVLLRQARAAQAKVIRTHSVLRSAEANAAKQLGALRQAIADGVSTGDPITDYVVVNYGDIDGKNEAVFRNLEQKVLAHGGELALIISSFSYQTGCTGFGGNGHIARMMILGLGLLEQVPTGLILNLDQTNRLLAMTSWALPTSRYTSSSASLSGEPSLHDGALSGDSACEITTDLAIKSDDPDPKTRALVNRSERWDAVTRLEIYIGNQDVIEQLREDDPAGTLLAALGYSPATLSLF